MNNLRENLTDIGEKVCSQNMGLREVEDEWSRLEAVGRGVGRTVLKLDVDEFGCDVVVKFAHNRLKRKGGIDQNQYESFMWSEASVDEKKFLAPVFDSNNRGLWLVMQYAESVPESLDLEQKRDKMYEIFGKRVDSTFRRRNFGVINGDIKLIDYGYAMDK